MKALTQNKHSEGVRRLSLIVGVIVAVVLPWKCPRIWYYESVISWRFVPVHFAWVDAYGSGLTFYWGINWIVLLALCAGSFLLGGIGVRASAWVCAGFGEDVESGSLPIDEERICTQPPLSAPLLQGAYPCFFFFSLSTFHKRWNLKRRNTWGGWT